MTVQLEEEESMHVDEKDGDTAVAGVLDWGAILSLVDESLAKRAWMTPSVGFSLLGRSASNIPIAPSKNEKTLSRSMDYSWHLICTVFSTPL
jgi:hypothetical protein